ncbi:MAG: octanoyltransferase, partial [Psychrobacter sp.]|nr:octanoyltransferase [Psychrobacter sp.]
QARSDAPGVYLYSTIDDNANKGIENNDPIMLGKIASLGFKIKHGFSYHGIALNIDCDLAAFNAINPCGYAGMQMLRLSDFVDMSDVNTGAKSLNYAQVTQKLIDNIAQRHAGLIELRSVVAK